MANCESRFLEPLSLPDSPFLPLPGDVRQPSYSLAGRWCSPQTTGPVLLVKLLFVLISILFLRSCADARVLTARLLAVCSLACAWTNSWARTLIFQVFSRLLASRQSSKMFFPCTTLPRGRPTTGWRYRCFAPLWGETDMWIWEDPGKTWKIRRGSYPSLASLQTAECEASMCSCTNGFRAALQLTSNPHQKANWPVFSSCQR